MSTYNWLLGIICNFYSMTLSRTWHRVIGCFDHTMWT